MKNLKILILSSNTYPSVRNSKVQKKIFSNDEYRNKILWYKGGTEEQLASKEANLIGRDLYINASDDALGMGDKTIKSFEWLLKNTDFEYLFRTNTSSFIDFRKFEKYISDNIENIDYSGSTLKASEGDTIASGAGFFLSKKNVEIIVNNKKEFNASLPDDVAIARLLSQFNMVPNDLRRKDLKAVPSPGSVFNSDHFHYRCRLDPQYHRILEPLLMRYLDRVSKNTRFLSFINYYFLKLIFNFSNIQVIYKIIQKYYSFKFYGEIKIGKKTIFSIQKNGLKN